MCDSSTEPDPKLDTVCVDTICVAPELAEVKEGV